VLPVCGATFIGVFALQIHELIYYTTIRSITSDSSHCVAKFENSRLVLYNGVSSLIHYLVPFSIQVICITLLIVLAARVRVKSAGNATTFHKILKQQFEKNKELYVTPTMIIMSSLPQLILAFTLGCAEWRNWQRHALLVAYLLSYTPQVLGFIFYVLPSTSYKAEFLKTRYGTVFSKSMFRKKNNELKTTKKTEK
jgi:ABC-type proline/glycine betaine transport system permease subunit